MEVQRRAKAKNGTLATPVTEANWPVNDPRRWHEVGQTPVFDLDAFQQRINTIAGLTISNQPIVRIVDMRQRLEWLSGHWRLKYRYFAHPVETVNGTRWLDFAPPRYVLEERIEPARYLASWEELRWLTDDDGTQIDVLGAPQNDGLYVPFHDICEHRHDCCDPATGQSRRYSGFKCYGMYRHPNESDLDRLRFIRRAIEQAGDYSNPQEPMTARELAEIARETRLFNEKNEEARAQQFRAYLDQKYDLSGWRLFEDDATKLAQGKYFFTKQLNGKPFESSFFKGAN